VERVRLEEVLTELELGRTSKIDRASAVRVGKLLGARYLVMGSYFDFKDHLHVAVTIVSVETGAVVGGVRDRKKTEDFWALEQHLAAELGKVIRDKLTGPAARKPAKGARPAGVKPAKGSVQARKAPPAPR